jgi:hypothetical protein
LEEDPSRTCNRNLSIAIESFPSPPPVEFWFLIVICPSTNVLNPLLRHSLHRGRTLDKLVGMRAGGQRRDLLHFNEELVLSLGKPRPFLLIS